MLTALRIPNEPKASLKNYLLDLINDRDEKESSVYLGNVESFIKEIWQEMTIKNRRTLNIKSLIPENLGVTVNMIYAYKNGIKSISIQTLYKLLLLWQKHCNKTQEDVEKKWDEIFKSNFYLITHSKCQKTILPRYITPKLSYLIGWLCGDGHFSIRTHEYAIKISEKSTKQLNLILRPLFKELFNLDVPIFKGYMNGYRIQVGSKPLHRFLTKVLKIKVGEIPEIVNQMDKINKQYFLIGVFDSEGCISGRITISQSNKNFLNKIIELAEELNMKFTGPYLHKTKLGTWYHIQIRKKEDIVKFYKTIGTLHLDKLEKLEYLVNGIESRNSRPSLTLG